MRGRLFARCAMALCAAAMLLPSHAAYAAEGNLALKKPVVADSKEADSVRPELAVDGNTTARESRWGSAVDASHGEHWIYVDLGKDEKVSSAKVYWEARKATGFKIQVATAADAKGDDAKTWGWKDVYTTAERPKDKTSVVNFDETTARYVRLLITGFEAADPDGKVDTWDSVSIYELEVYGEKQEGQTPDQPEGTATNLALKKQTKASVDYHKENGARAVDGKKKDSKADRWMTETKPTANNPQWLVVDLGKTETIKHIEAMWEDASNYSKKFSVYVSDKKECWDTPTAKDAWGKAVYTTDNNTAATSTITLETPATGRYVKLEISEVVGWGASCMEFEVWDAVPPAPGKQPADYLNEIVVDPVTATTAKLSYKLPEAPEGYEITYNGTDYEQVIDLDGTIYRPLTDVTVKSSFKITNKTDNTDYAFKEFDVKVPGTATVAQGANAAPQVLPQLREWAGSTGSFAASAAKRVVYGHDSLKVMAEEFAADYQALTGVKLSVAQGSAAQTGDIFFTLGADKAQGLKDEGYLLEVTSDRMTVKAEDVAGANWGGKTILQGMKTGSGTFPLGTARDYPLYKVRGLILDVGRKTFTLDWLKQMTKQLAWFKLNDFQIHLNDNLIPLEYYTNKGEDAMKAYSGFRLESNIKKGGNDGKNQADLTSTDVWYSKSDFKEYIEHSAALGVNIVPEIDTPAHSLALTKVRPDLRYGDKGRQNDHLDLRGDKFDQSLDFVQSIFDEYLTGGDSSVFAGSDVIHIGADEYNVGAAAESGPLYRKFVNEMFDYARKNGKTPRVWGSLSQYTQGEEIHVNGGEGEARAQINLWNWGYANMDKMYEMGFDLIDCNDGHFYIVPNAGYYYDYLNDDVVYTDPLNSISKVTIPAGDPQVVGGAFAVWNDMTDYLENGVTEHDVYDRITAAAGLFGANAWGRGSMNTAQAKAASVQLGDVPNVNFDYEVAASESGAIAQWNMDDLTDASGMGRDLVEGKNAKLDKVDGRSALKLNGGESYMTVKDDALTTVGLGNDLRVKVKRTSDSTEPQVLFESEYGTIMAVQEGTGKVGFTREKHVFSFNYELPVNEWVELEFKNELNKTHLYVNGKLVDTLGDGDKAAEGKALKATTMFPVNKIGSATNAFQGYVDDVRLAKDGTFASTMELDHAVVTAEAVLSTGDVPGLRALLDQAYAMMRNANPDAQAIADLTAQIYALLQDENGDPAYKTADYCRLDAYAQLQGGAAAEQLAAMFTPESVARLQAAWSQVRYDLPAAMQQTVDGYVTSVVRALDALEVKGSGNLNFIDPTLLQGKATSTEEQQPESNAFDDNLNTLWHSKWGNEHAKLPISFDISLKSGETMAVDALVYTPRPDGGNGNLTGYEIYAGDNLDQLIASGTLKQDAEVKTITFDRVETKKLRLTFTKAAGNFASAAEIRLSDANATGDFDGLNLLVDAAKQIKQDGSCEHDCFTDETWGVLTQAIAKAEEAVASGAGDVNEVHALKGELARAIVGLRLVDDGGDQGGNGGDQGGNGGDQGGNGENVNPPQTGGDENKPGNNTSGNALPQTGDSSMLVVAGVGAVAVVAIVAGVVMSRRKKH